MSHKMKECLQLGRQCLKQLRESGLYDPLVPRAVPAGAVSDFLASKQRDAGYLIIVAEPGIGKTGFMLNLCSNAAIFYSFQDRLWSANILNFLNYLTAELHLRLGKDTPLPRYLYTPDDARMRIDSLLDRVGQNLSKDEKLLILVDALDEAYLGDRTNAQLLKFNPTSGVYFVCTSRREPRILDQLAYHPDVSMSQWSKNERTIAEVADYINNCLPQTCTTLEKHNLEASADGNFRLVSLLLDGWKKGTVSLETMPTKPLTLNTFLKDQWQNRILKSARMPDLCEDVATLLAAAREPLSASIITSAIRHQGVVNLKVRNVHESLVDIATFVKWEPRGELKRCRPYDASFGRWLEEFYAGDLCRAHRALALSLTEVLKSNSSPDFDIAVRNACWHLRQWAKNAVDISQKEHARDILNNLTDDSELRARVEQGVGANAYLVHFLHEAVKCSEESGSLPNLIRFGTRYVNYRINTEGFLSQLQKLIKDGGPIEIAEMGQSMPEGPIRRGYFAFIACCAIDGNRHDVLAKALDLISREEPESGFVTYFPLAAALIIRLGRLQRKGLVKHILSVASNIDAFDFVAHYLPYVATSVGDFILYPDLAAALFEKSLRACGSQFWAKTLVEILLDTTSDADQSAHLIIKAMQSFRDREMTVSVSELLADAFIKRRLYLQAREIMEIAFINLSASRPERFADGTKQLLAALPKASQEEAACLTRRVLDIIDAPDCNPDFVRADILAAYACYLADCRAVHNSSPKTSEF